MSYDAPLDRLYTGPETVRRIVRSAIPLPKKLRGARLDVRGLPIPFTVHIPEEQRRVENPSVDFRVISPTNIRRAVFEGLCAVCGKPHSVLNRKYSVCFIGGPKSAANRCFVDPPVHRACGLYALQTCPFLAAPSYAHAYKPRKGDDALVIDSSVEPERPEVFALCTTDQYMPVERPLGLPILVAEPYTSIEWFRNGQHAFPPEGFVVVGPPTELLTAE